MAISKQVVKHPNSTRWVGAEVVAVVEGDVIVVTGSYPVAARVPIGQAREIIDILEAILSSS